MYSDAALSRAARRETQSVPCFNSYVGELCP
jgi:hypothetical protein